MNNQTPQKQEKLKNYQVLQRQRENKLDKKANSLKNSIETSKQKLFELEQELTSLQSKQANLEKTREEFLAKESAEIRERRATIASLEEHQVSLTETLSSDQTQLDAILAEKRKESEDSPRSREIKSRIAYINTEINEYNFKITEYKKEAKKEQTLSAQIEKLKQSEVELKNLIASGETSPKRNYVDELEVATKQRLSYEKQLEDFRNLEHIEIARLNSLISEMTLESKQLDSELAELRQYQDNATVAMERIEAEPEVIELRKNIAEATATRSENGVKIQLLNTEIADLKAKELENAKAQGKEAEYTAQKSQNDAVIKDIEATKVGIASNEKARQTTTAQMEKNQAKLVEIEAAIHECDNYNTWVANNRKFSEEMYPKSLELATADLKEDRTAATEACYAKLEEEAREEIKDQIEDCVKKAAARISSKKFLPKGALKDSAASAMAQSSIKRRLIKHIEDKIDAGTSETWNKQFRKIRDARLNEIEKSIKDAEKRIATGNNSDEAKAQLEECKLKKEMFLRAEKDNTLLVIKNVRKYFPVEKSFFGRPLRYLKAVDDVSLRIQKGKTLGIVGESGCGKTTMGRTVLRLHDITDGEIIFNGTHLEKLSSGGMRGLRTDLQIIFQDPYSSLSPRLPVGEIIGEAVRAHKLVSNADYRDYVMEIMKSCGLQPHHFSRFPHEFSGGQRQRICIARALAVNPKVVICDEPVSALDVSIQAQIINLLKDLQKTRNLTYIFISHDLSVVEHISDDVGVMYLGSMVESGPKEKIFDNPMHPYTEALLSAVPVPDPNIKMNRIYLKGDIPSPSRPPRGCKFHTRCHKCMDICKTMPPVYREYEKDHFVACHLYPQD